MRKFHESSFDVDNYEDFYSDHFFQPLTDDDSVNAHRVIPRVGWGLDIAKEIGAKHILDLGCLDGSNLLTLLNNLPTGAQGTGVDLSKDGVEIAVKRASLHGLPAEFIQGSIEEYLANTKDGTFDLVCLYEVIEHVIDPDAVVAEIKRVLKPGGTILVSTPDFEAPTYGKTDTRNKCHIRLYTTADADYESTFTGINEGIDLGKQVTRTATSMPKQLKDWNVVSMDVFSELIHARATK
jgi:2-polyprenyl-3-methyl-5-hydroxy-6-metoxy-1,4-benzoquinol methylase